MSRLTDIWDRLTARQRDEVADFAQFLADAPRRRPQPPRFITGEGWSGGLSSLKGGHASGVELQHEALRAWEKFD